MLSAEQVSHFRTFGHLVVRQLFEAGEMATICEEYERGFAFAREGADPVGQRLQLNWPNLGPRTPYLARLPEDDRIGGVAEQILGEDAAGTSSNGNHFRGPYTEWHPDARNPHSLGLKFILYLDPLRADTGALRVMSCSHLSPYREQLAELKLGEDNLEDGIEGGLHITDMPSFVCESEPGDAILFDVRTWHASWGGTQGRRMCSSTFYGNPQTPEEQEATRALAGAARGVQRTLKWKESKYHPDWLANPDNSARRQRWIDWLTRWDFLRDA